MAATSTQSQHHVRNVAVGRYLEDDTAVEFDIECGFKPRYVCVINVTDREMIEWYEGMADASALYQAAAGTRTLITTLGITPLTDGFTVGLQLNVNVVNKQLSWIAIG